MTWLAGEIEAEAALEKGSTAVPDGKVGVCQLTWDQWAMERIMYFTRALDVLDPIIRVGGGGRKGDSHDASGYGTKNLPRGGGKGSGQSQGQRRDQSKGADHRKGKGKDQGKGKGQDQDKGKGKDQKGKGRGSSQGASPRKGHGKDQGPGQEKGKGKGRRRTGSIRGGPPPTGPNALSHLMADVLRHDGCTSLYPMTEDGWMTIDVLLTHPHGVRYTPGDVLEEVRRNNKGMFTASNYADTVDGQQQVAAWAGHHSRCDRARSRRPR
jgi:hypothetical protein